MIVIREKISLLPLEMIWHRELVFE